MKGDGMVTELHWMVIGHLNVPAIQSTEWWLKGHWMGILRFKWSCISSCNTKGTHHGHAVQFQIIYLKDEYQTVRCLKLFSTYQNTFRCDR